MSRHEDDRDERQSADGDGWQDLGGEDGGDDLLWDDDRDEDAPILDVNDPIDREIIAALHARNLPDISVNDLKKMKDLSAERARRRKSR
jgi:hypothetical protein